MITISPSDISTSFTQIANDLFNKYVIQVNDNYYRLLEIEFYYNNSKDHNDTYTHGHKWQKRSNYWYVHPSGIDISIGNETASGGILLQSVEKLSPAPTDKKEQYIFGPQKVVTELMSGFHNCFSNQPNTFRLVSPEQYSLDFPQVPQDEIIRCTRIGLSPKDETFHKSLYRYLIYPKLRHKEKTNIAESLASQWGTSKELLDRIKELLGSEFLNKYRTKEYL